MQIVFQTARATVYRSVESYGEEFWVYGVTASGDPMTAPTLDMARAIAEAHS